MGKKGRHVPQKHLKSNTTSAQRKREERETKLRLRKEQARQRNYESNEEKEFSKELQEKGYVVCIVDGDGNCMFRSISDQLYGTTDRHSEVRQKIVNYMSEHDDHFRLFVEDDEPFDEYISRMHTAREWGGHQELYAASCCYNANIFVYQLQTPRWMLPAPDDVCPSDTVTINLSYHGEYHYNSLHLDSNFDPKMSSAKESIVVDSASRKEKEKVEKEQGDMLAQLQDTLPWICPTSAAASLEACDFQFLKAVEHAIEHFFSAEQEQQQAQETRESDALKTVDNSSAVAVTDDPPPPSTLRKTKSSKVKVRPGLSKKEKRLLKKEKHVGAISKSGPDGGNAGLNTVTTAVCDIIL